MNKQNVFINNTSFIFSSVFNLSAKVFHSSNEDFVKLKGNLNNYFRFIIAVTNNDKSYRMLFVISKDEKHLQLIQTPIINDASFFENGESSLLMDFWYNFSAIYMFSFLDTVECIGGSSICDDLPTEISQSECLMYFDSASIVMGMDTMSMSDKCDKRNDIIVCVGMLS